MPVLPGGDPPQWLSLAAIRHGGWARLLSARAAGGLASAAPSSASGGG